MKKINFIILLFTCFFLISCNSKQSNKPNVISTIGMIHSIVVEIGGDNIQAKSLMGPGVDPHLYKATAKDVQLLSRADLIFYNGFL